MSQSLGDLSLPVRLFEIMGTTQLRNSPSPTCLICGHRPEKRGQQIRMETVPGTVTQGEDGLAQYVTDDQALREMVLNLFYESEQTESYESQE